MTIVKIITAIELAILSFTEFMLITVISSANIYDEQGDVSVPSVIMLAILVANTYLLLHLGRKQLEGRNNRS